MEKKEEKIFRDIVKILEQDVPQEALAEGNPTPEQEAIALIKQELDKAREEGRLSVIQELLFEPEEPSHNISTLEAAFKYEDIIKRYSEEWRNKTKLISPKYIKSKLKDNK